MARSARWRRHALHAAFAIAALLVVIVAGAGILLASIDTDELKPRIAEAVQRATGRELTLNGQIRLDLLSLQPSVHVSDVSFANPPGFSRPMMATLQRVDLRLALLPLLRHRIEIESLSLVAPDLLLESNADGETNWVFPRHARPDHEDRPASDRIGIQDVRIEGGTIAYRDERTASAMTFDVTELLMQAASPDSPLHLMMQASANGAAFSLDGDVGPISRLQESRPGPPWPVRLHLAAGAAALAIEGTVGHPAKARLYALQLTGSAPDIAPLAAFMPGTHLPPLRDASVSVRLVDTGKHLDLDSSLQVSGVTVSAKGEIADTAHLAGIDIALFAGATDLAAISAQAGLTLPPFQSIEFRAHLTDAATGLSDGLTLRDIRFTSKQAEIAGNVVADFSPRPSLRAQLAAARIDAGALRTTSATSAPTQTGTTRLAIPDIALPFELLRAFDADIQLDIASLRSRRTEYRSIGARLALQNGRLVLAPFTIELPEGRLTGALGADATQPSPQIDLVLHAPGLAVQPLLTALGLSEEISGKMRVILDLHGSGNTPHAIAAGLNGHLGLAMGRGTVSNWLLGNTIGWALREAALPFLALQIGSSQLRCFALRLDFKDGVGELNSLLLDSSPLYLDGSGTVALRDETIDLRLRPEPMVAGLGVFAPLHLSGTLAHPRVRPDPLGAAQANAGILMGVVEWAVAPINWAAATLGVIGPQDTDTDNCIGALMQGRATETALQPLPPLPPLLSAR